MLRIHPHVKLQLAALGSITFVKPGCVHLKPNLGCIRWHSLVPPLFHVWTSLHRREAPAGAGEEGGEGCQQQAPCWYLNRSQSTARDSVRMQEHSGSCTGECAVAQMQQLGAPATFHQKTQPLPPTLSPTVTTNSASPCSKSDFVHNRSKALGTLQAQSGHFLPFSCNKEPFRLGLQNQTGLQEKPGPAVA